MKKISLRILVGALWLVAICSTFMHTPLGFSGVIVPVVAATVIMVVANRPIKVHFNKTGLLLFCFSCTLLLLFVALVVRR